MNEESLDEVFRDPTLIHVISSSHPLLCGAPYLDHSQASLSGRTHDRFLSRLISREYEFLNWGTTEYTKVDIRIKGTPGFKTDNPGTAYVYSQGTHSDAYPLGGLYPFPRYNQDTTFIPFASDSLR